MLVSCVCMCEKRWQRHTVNDSLPPPIQPQPPTRRAVAGAALLSVGTTLGFTAAFGGRGGGGGGADANAPFRVVQGRVFVKTSDGDVLAVRRAPRDPRTLLLVGDSGSYVLKLGAGVKVKGVSDGDLLTRVFGGSAWERALVPLEPGSK